MLTRYRELYNNLTNSKAFAETGVMDNKVVDKNNFTPNNLKAIILGASGIVVVYFTSTKTNSHLVSYLPFTKLPKTDEEFAQSLKSEKGMVDALCDGLKFSNLEEIFLSTDGFNSVDAEKEYTRLLAFVNNKLLIQKSFKRLRGVGLIKATLTKDSASELTSKDTLASQFKKVDISIQPILTLEPEKNEYGLPKNIELDNGEYKLDAKYNPDADAKERESQDCRLSRYFYKLEQDAKKPKEEAERAQVSHEEVEVDKVAIDVSINRVMKVYRDLYKSCFGLKKPAGLLVKGGILTIKDGVTVVEKSQMYMDLYNLTVASTDYVIKAIAQQEGISKDDLYKIPLSGTYFPLFHLAVLYGRTPNWVFKSWDKPETRKLKDGSTIKTTLENEISKLLRHKLEETVKNGGELNDISDKLCTSFVVAELAKSGNDTPLMFKLKFSAGNAKFNQETFANTFKSGGDKYLAGDAKITSFKPKSTGVAKINLCLNEEVYQKMPLFGYEAVEHKKANGEMVGIENCIIGQTREDEILTINLKDDNNCKIINVMAGARSGKGVLTQSLEGAILADGCPLIYMDAKPDMATVLNEVANKNGLRVAAWDLNTPPLEYLKNNTNINTLSDAVRTKLSTLGSAAPNLVRDKSGKCTWGLLAYLKMIQLSAVSAIMQLEGKITASGKGNAFFILDELLRVMSELEVLYKILSNLVKDKEIDDTNKNWAKKMIRWIEDLGNELNGAVQSEIPKSNTNIICIYQEPTPFRDENIVTNVFRPYVRATTTTRLVGGKGAHDVIEGIQSLQGDDKAGISLVSNYYHFAKFNGRTLKKGGANYEIFKPYLVLNDADPNGEYVSKMAKIIGTEAYNDLLARGGGTVPKGVGFEGYMETIGDNGIQNLSKGYEYLTTMLEATGLSRKYSCIEEYLYDADISSFYARNALVEGRAGAVVEENKPKFDTASSGSWDLESESEDEKEIKLFDSSNTSNEEASPRPQAQQTAKTQAQSVPIPQSQAKSEQYQQQTSRPQPQQASIPQQTGYTQPTAEAIPNYSNAYKGLISVPITENPFNYGGNVDGINTLGILKKMTKFILDDIINIRGGLDKVRTLQITKEGVFIIDNTPYQPTFNAELLNSLPLMVREKVDAGAILEIFYLKEIYKFSKLEKLIVDDKDLAQGRLRNELAIPAYQRYSYLFKKFKDTLYFIKVGEKEYTKDTPDFADPELNEIVQELPFKDRLRNFGTYLFGPAPEKTPSRMSNFWNSKTVKLLRTGFGYSAGTKLVLASTVLFGPWSIVFGAIVLSLKYQEHKAKQLPNNSVAIKPTVDNKTSGKATITKGKQQQQQGKQQGNQKRSSTSKNDREHNAKYIN